MIAPMRLCAPLPYWRRCAQGRTQVRAYMRIGGVGDWRARRPVEGIGASGGLRHG